MISMLFLDCFLANIANKSSIVVWGLTCDKIGDRGRVDGGEGGQAVCAFIIEIECCEGSDIADAGLGVAGSVIGL